VLYPPNTIIWRWTGSNVAVCPSRGIGASNDTIRDHESDSSDRNQTPPSTPPSTIMRSFAASTNAGRPYGTPGGQQPVVPSAVHCPVESDSDHTTLGAPTRPEPLNTSIRSLRSS